MPARSKQGFTFELPSLPRLDLPSIAELAGAPRRQHLDLRPILPWLTPPAWFVNSLAEWVVYFYLTVGRAWSGHPVLKPVGPTQEPVRGTTFFYQIRVPNLGHFQSEVTRVDFLLPGFGGMGYEALAIDPYNTWTHPSPDLDFFKRETLATQANIELIWILTDRLEAGDFEVIEQALRGADESPRALFGI